MSWRVAWVAFGLCATAASFAVAREETFGVRLGILGSVLVVSLVIALIVRAVWVMVRRRRIRVLSPWLLIVAANVLLMTAFAAASRPTRCDNERAELVAALANLGGQLSEPDATTARRLRSLLGGARADSRGSVHRVGFGGDDKAVLAVAMSSRVQYEAEVVAHAARTISPIAPPTLDGLRIFEYEGDFLVVGTPRDCSAVVVIATYEQRASEIINALVDSES